MDELKIWEQLKDTPIEARRTISGGKLNGFTDINPMWRLKRLTEVFGPCGIGWTYSITSQREVAGANGEVAVFLDIQLQVKIGDQWSAPIPGLGGSMLVSTERGKLATNDEAYKMALSDAIGTACKALGMSEDVYMSGKGKTGSKYQQDAGKDAPVTPKEAADFVLPFGDYRGKTLREVFNADKKYLTWFLGQEGYSPEVKNKIRIMLGAVSNGSKQP